MENKNDILEELQSLSPQLAELQKVNVFSVPAGYFEYLPATVLACVNPAVEAPTAGEEVPQGYFDNLAGSILQRIKAGQTSKEEIDELSPLLHAIRNKKVYEVPAGYFDTTSSQIFARLREEKVADELNALSPLLAGIEKVNVFSIPDGYFTELPVTILGKVTSGKGRVVKMGARNLFAKYAAAAMMIGVIAFGVFKYTGKPNDSNGTQSQIAGMDAAIEQGRRMDDQQFNEALKSLSTTDITNYLEVNGDITDMTALGNNVDESVLPKQEDYLLDEKTLDNYLKQLELTTLTN